VLRQRQGPGVKFRLSIALYQWKRCFFKRYRGGLIPLQTVWEIGTGRGERFVCVLWRDQPSFLFLCHHRIRCKAYILCKAVKNVHIIYQTNKKTYGAILFRQGATRSWLRLTRGKHAAEHAVGIERQRSNEMEILKNITISTLLQNTARLVSFSQGRRPSTSTQAHFQTSNWESDSGHPDNRAVHEAQMMQAALLIL